MDFNNHADVTCNTVVDFLLVLGNDWNRYSGLIAWFSCDYWHFIRKIQKWIQMLLTFILKLQLYEEKWNNICFVNTA